MENRSGGKLMSCGVKTGCHRSEADRPRLFIYVISPNFRYMLRLFRRAAIS